jgi:Cu2+-exporting ATPase
MKRGGKALKQYQVIGMSCAACSAKIEKAVGKVPGVDTCAVSLLTHSMQVEGRADSREILRAVEKAGYRAVLQEAGGEKQGENPEELLRDRETPRLKKRLIASLLFLALLMYLSMGHMVGLPQIPFFGENPMAMGLAQLLLSGSILVINQSFFIRGAKGLYHGSPNMDTLVALGAAASFGWSICVLFRMTTLWGSSDREQLMGYVHELYFESAATIVALITLGKMLEAHSKGRTTDALKALLKLAPRVAHIRQDGEEREIPVEQVEIGMVFLVRPGETIPVDGRVQ